VTITVILIASAVAVAFFAGYEISAAKSRRQLSALGEQASKAQELLTNAAEQLTALGAESDCLREELAKGLEQRAQAIAAEALEKIDLDSLKQDVVATVQSHFGDIRGQFVSLVGEIEKHQANVAKELKRDQIRQLTYYYDAIKTIQNEVTLFVQERTGVLLSDDDWSEIMDRSIPVLIAKVKAQELVRQAQADTQPRKDAPE
jgi:hypothetical protein